MEYSTNKIKITKATTFFADSYQSHHAVDVLDFGTGLESVSLVWDKGIRNTEKNISDVLNVQKRDA